MPAKNIRGKMRTASSLTNSLYIANLLTPCLSFFWLRLVCLQSRFPLCICMVSSAGLQLCTWASSSCECVWHGVSVPTAPQHIPCHLPLQLLNPWLWSGSSACTGMAVATSEENRAHKAGAGLELGSYLCICSAAFSACYRMCARIAHHSIRTVEIRNMN